MKKLLLPLILIPLQTLSAAESATDKNYLEVTYFAHATHKPFIQNDSHLNNKLNMFSVAYRNDYQGVELSTFKNSYFRRSVALSYVRYWHPAKHVETAMHIGGVTGYSETPALFALSVAYTKYDVFRPKISWFGEAIVFSISIKF